jgi:hypothetical protein
VVEVKFDWVGFAYVGVAVKPENTPTMSYLSYKVDTGANRTTIGRSWLYALGYDEDWIKTGRLLTGDERPTLATGGSIDDCYIVTLPEIHIGDWVGYNWPVLTSLSSEFRLLLGTDSMQFFNWNLDYAKGVCGFDLIPGKRKMLFNQKEQSIHSIDGINNPRDAD